MVFNCIYSVFFNSFAFNSGLGFNARNKQSDVYHNDTSVISHAANVTPYVTKGECTRFNISVRYA